MKNYGKKVYLGLGSNMGRRKYNITAALKKLAQESGLDISKVSSLYETEPVGGPKQKKFLNAVAEIQTTLLPEDLLKILKSIEKKIGRTESHAKWGPRVIDLDVLCYDDLIFKNKSLTIPHPLMHERSFVLVPFMEIAPDFKHPVLKKTIRDLCYGLEQSNGKYPERKSR